MPISDPDHWIEEGHFKGPKYDKIVEMITAINAGGTPAHASTHQDGGGDEISVTDLSGLLADAQTPLSHDNAKHSTNYEAENANIQSHVGTPPEDSHHPKTHNNTEHSTNYEAANANIQSHVGTPPEDSHHPKTHNNTEHSTNYATEAALSSHEGDDNAHHEVLESLLGDTTPQLGGELDVNQKHINLNTTALVSGNATGIIVTLTAGATLAFPNLVCFANDGECLLASMTSSNSAPAIGMALTSATDGNPIDILLWGYVYYTTWGWAAGPGEAGLLYLGTAGNMQQTPSGNPGHQIQVVATAVGADWIIFNPSYVLVERGS